MNNKTITEKVTIIGLVPLDFTASDGNHICGYTVHYYRDKKDNENAIGKVVEKVYLAQNDLSDKEKYSIKTFPINGAIEYEFVSLTRKPKPVKLII